MSNNSSNDKAALKECNGGGNRGHGTSKSRYAHNNTNNNNNNLPEDTLDRFNRQLDMQNNNAPAMVGSPSTTTATTTECRLFINPNVYSDYAIGRYIDDTSQTRTLSSATSTAALGQESSWTWRSVSPFSRSDLVRSVSGGGGACGNSYGRGGGGFSNVVSGECVDNWSADRSLWQYPSYAQPNTATTTPTSVTPGTAAGKFHLLRTKFMRSRRNKLNRFSNKIAETTQGSAYIRPENGFQRTGRTAEEEDKLRMLPQAAVVAATSVMVPPKVKPKVSKGPSRGGISGGGAGAGRGSGGAVGDLNDPMMRRPRRKMSEQQKEQKKEQDVFAQFVSPDKYEQTWYLFYYSI